MDSRRRIQGPPPFVEPRPDRLIGYAAIWGRPAFNPLRGRLELVTPETFAESLVLARPVGFADPSDGAIELAGTSDGSLILTADAVGLRVMILPHGAGGAFEGIADQVSAGVWGALAPLYAAQRITTARFSGVAVDVVERADLVEVLAVAGDVSSDTVLTVGEAGSSYPSMLARRNATLARGARPGTDPGAWSERRRRWLRWLCAYCEGLTDAARADIAASIMRGAARPWPD